MAPTTAKSARHISSLDGLRGVAFLSVFFYHYGKSSHADAQWVAAARSLTGVGWVGVDLFFVLSGFLITGILLDTTADPDYFRTFYARRALRIFPLFYGVALVLLLLTPLLRLQWHLGHLAFLAYFGNVAGDFAPGLYSVQPALDIGHTWSLAIEEQFYLLWPLVIYLVRDRRKLIAICLGSMVVSLLLRIMFVHISPTLGPQWGYRELPSHSDGLLAGAVVAILLRRVSLAQLIRHSTIPLVAALAGLAVVVRHDGGFRFQTGWCPIVGYPLLAFVFAALLLRTIASGSLFERIGQNAILRFFGRYSYGMYIYHLLFFPLIGGMLPILQRRMQSASLGGLAYVAIVLAGTSVVSVLSFELYERQWLKLKSRFSYARQGPRMTTRSSGLETMQPKTLTQA